MYKKGALLTTTISSWLLCYYIGIVVNTFMDYLPGSVSFPKIVSEYRTLQRGVRE
jgi:hypothetical protein